MKVLCFLITLLLYLNELICSHHLNVGTVLFTKADLCRKCWTESERTLLVARQVMQGVLPDPDFMDITKAGTISVLLEYFQSCFDAVCQSTCGKTQHLMFLGLSDALGGYLRSYILPITRQAYYAGQIKYLEASKIFRFYEEIKDFLKTNGGGWARPRSFTLNCKIRPLKITTKGCDAACNQLYFKEEAKAQICYYPEDDNATETTQEPTQAPCSSESTRTSHPQTQATEGDAAVKQKLIDIIRGMKNQKYADASAIEEEESRVSPRVRLTGRNVQRIEKIRKNAKKLKDRLMSSIDGRLSESGCHHPSVKTANYSSIDELLRQMKKLRKRRGFCDRKSQTPDVCCSTRGIIIPLPVLDDTVRPNAIGLPFKVRPLRSLKSPHSICILVRYYMTVMKCLVTKSNNKCDVLNFNAQFHSWLASYIFPHLSDEEWYPAFGGVLRIEETIKNFGCHECGKCRPCPTNDIGFMFSKGFAFDESDYLKNEDSECPEEEVMPRYRAPDRTYLTLAILAIVGMWIMAFCYCICCYCPGVRSDDEDDQCGNLGGSDKKYADPNNSFIVQCLIKFFKRSNAEEGERKSSGEGLKVMRDVDDDLSDDESEVELLNRPLSPVDNSRRTGRESSRRSMRGGERRRSLQGRDAIVLPAQIGPLNTELPLGLTSFWPFTDEMEMMKTYPEKNVKPAFDQPEPPPKPVKKEKEPPAKDKEQCKTIWKREISTAQTSESCGEMVAKTASAPYRNEGNFRERSESVKEKSSSESSSYSDNTDSEEDGRKRVVYIRRSRSGFNYPRSYNYSYNSSDDSYSSSSRVEGDIPVELYNHIVACHNSFAKRARPDIRQKQKSESESDRGLTSSSTGSASSSSMKRAT